MGVVFAKTPLGQEEMEQRSGKLTPRVRRVLIFVDGKRTVDDLRAMTQAADLQHTLGLLCRQAARNAGLRQGRVGCGIGMAQDGADAGTLGLRTLCTGLIQALRSCCNRGSSRCSGGCCNRCRGRFGRRSRRRLNGLGVAHRSSLKLK